MISMEPVALTGAAAGFTSGGAILGLAATGLGVGGSFAATTAGWDGGGGAGAACSMCDGATAGLGAGLDALLGAVLDGRTTLATGTEGVGAVTRLIFGSTGVGRTAGRTAALARPTGGGGAAGFS